MTPQEKNYFEALYRDRNECANMLKKPSMRGINNSIVEKYSDQAHFIYELLQNADDAKASSVRLVLERDRLVFAHNGTRYFSISNPQNEDIDSNNGTLGDINAITSVANSNKTSVSIGKFGIGFKAVFQYTENPMIYDPHFRFKIENLFVPSLLEEDYPDRQPDETLFVFPFNSPKRNADTAYQDILNKLVHLSFPLLFLSNLKEIHFEYGDTKGSYEKKIIKKTTFCDGITAELICHTLNDGKERNTERLWLFSRSDDKHLIYSVCFFLQDDGHLRPTNKPAFCFFPTKEKTGLNFIIHAPFLLTDNREGILASESHNVDMIYRLADLAAESIVHMKEMSENRSIHLIDDNIIEIIPYNPDIFSDPADKSMISFYPFYESIRNVFKRKEIIPSVDGYVSKENAYWATVPSLTQFFGKEQLSEICDNESACWAFPSIGRDGVQKDSKDKALCFYIDDITKTYLDDDAIIKGRRASFYNPRLSEWQNLEPIKGITPQFIESQSITWLHKFYEWISISSNRTKAIRKKAVFLNQDKKASAAYDENDQLILFLPVEGVTSYNVVNQSLLSNPQTKSFLLDVIQIKQPSIKDLIYNQIRPTYEIVSHSSSSESSDFNSFGNLYDSHFKIIFDYFCNSTQKEAEDLIDLIKKWPILAYTKGPTDTSVLQNGYDTAASMYYPKSDLLEYYENNPDVRFVAIEKYKKIVGNDRIDDLTLFFRQLGVKQTIDLKTVSIDEKTRLDLPRPSLYTRSRPIKYEETIIEGCKGIIEQIIVADDKKKSILLWNVLLNIIKSNCAYFSLKELLCGKCTYYYYSQRAISFESSDLPYLLKKPWLLNRDGAFVEADRLTEETLFSGYDTSSDEAQDLIAFLGMSSTASEDESLANLSSILTESQRTDIELGRFVRENGVTKEELEEYLRYKRQNQNRSAISHPSNSSRGVDSPENNTSDASFTGNEGITANDGIEDEQKDDSELSGLEQELEALVEENDVQSHDESHEQNHVRRHRTVSVIKDIVKRIPRTGKKNTSVDAIPSEDVDCDADPDVDQDEYIPRAIDYKKQIDSEIQKSASSIRQIEHMEDLQKRALEAPKYSFGWFKALLEMECNNSFETNSKSREISIEFSKVEREPGTQRILVLKQPNRYIPQFMEDLADIPLVLHMANADAPKKVEIEVSNIKSYTLRVKLKNPDDINDIDCSAVRAATIDAKSPVFLLEELRRQFEKLGLPEDCNMQENLCSNIEFIFGPPGTGKTTYLACSILAPMMAGVDDKKVLVLTPTNKAADVLVHRIMDSFKEDHSYEDWLIRFGTTGDETIEKSPVFKDKTFDIRKFHRNVTVTTIARFPYDFFMPNGERLHLRELKWDYIIIDEASMIPLVSIIYPLYKKTPEKFIIAGDPFQIQPIAAVDLWKDENIYSLVHLDSFQNPSTVPHPYKIENLSTQYRSIPEIGKIFSEFAYDGILKHYRTSESRIPLNLGDELDIKPLNILKFPVSKYESIYRTKRLQHRSAYQIYSALFTYEYICYLSGKIAENNPGRLFKIGVVAPYRAQADLIEKLFSSNKMPKEVAVQVGTIHGFQGDECDMVFSIFNTPPVISRSREMFLNNRNIINVAISRARDYLFIVMPDNETENVSNLQCVKRVEYLVKQSDCWKESLTPDIEKRIFGEPNYLENNAFSTSHQSVNVYGLPETYYEVRTEENAVDVQIHKEK